MPKGVVGLKSLFFYGVPQRTWPQRFVSIGLATGSAIETNRCGRGLRHTTENKDLKPTAPLGMQHSPNNPTNRRGPNVVPTVTPAAIEATLPILEALCIRLLGERGRERHRLSLGSGGSGRGQGISPP